MSRAHELLQGSDVNLPSLECLFSIRDEKKALSVARTALEACTTSDVREAIKEREERVRGSDVGRILAHSSVTKPKMIKHCLGFGIGDVPPYRIWLHEYRRAKNTPDQPYVEGIHNQRYPIASLILRGSYHACEFRESQESRLAPPSLDNTRTDLEYWTDHQRTLEKTQAHYGEGSVMTLPTWASHALSDIENDTCTLVLELPAVRKFSVAFDGPDGEATQIIHDTDYYRDQLMGRL